MTVDFGVDFGTAGDGVAPCGFSMVGGVIEGEGCVVDDD